MTKPLIQIALDQTNLPVALEVAENVHTFVDIIEVGTILAFAEGMNAVATLRQKYPNHILVCDMKTTDGGAILSKMAFEAGADWITVSAAAHIATIAACKKLPMSLIVKSKLKSMVIGLLTMPKIGLNLVFRKLFTIVPVMQNSLVLAGPMKISKNAQTV